MACLGDCVRVPLTNGGEMRVSPCDATWALAWKWRACGVGYAVLGGRGVATYLRLLGFVGVPRCHSLIMGRRPRPGLTVDHQDGDKLHNCRGNLRWATLSQQRRNARHRIGRSGYRGVSVGTSAFVARVFVDGRYRTLGSFRTAKEAAAVRDAAVASLYGEFAVLNRIECSGEVAE